MCVCVCVYAWVICWEQSMCVQVVSISGEDRGWKNERERERFYMWLVWISLPCQDVKKLKQNWKKIEIKHYWFNSVCQVNLPLDTNIKNILVTVMEGDLLYQETHNGQTLQSHCYNTLRA